MEETIKNVITGGGIVFSFSNILNCFIGCFVGTLVGVLPGIGPVGAVAILLPFTFDLPAVTAIIMLAGIFYGSQYGGSTTSILVNIPGEASSVITCVEGYQMAKNGRAGKALGIAAIASFIAGTFGVFSLMIVARPIAELALRFGPPEFFSLIFFALTLLTYLSSGPAYKAFTMAAVGVILGTVGIDSISGTYRLTFGIPELYDGIGLIPVCMGLFGVAEILVNLGEPLNKQIYKERIGRLLPNIEELKTCANPIARGSVLGFLLASLLRTAIAAIAMMTTKAIIPIAMNLRLELVFLCPM